MRGLILSSDEKSSSESGSLVLAEESSCMKNINEEQMVESSSLSSSSAAAAASASELRINVNGEEGMPGGGGVTLITGEVCSQQKKRKKQSVDEFGFLRTPQVDGGGVRMDGEMEVRLVAPVLLQQGMMGTGCGSRNPSSAEEEEYFSHKTRFSTPNNEFESDGGGVNRYGYGGGGGLRNREASRDRLLSASSSSLMASLSNPTSRMSNSNDVNKKGRYMKRSAAVIAANSTSTSKSEQRVLSSSSPRASSSLSSKRTTTSLLDRIKSVVVNFVKRISRSIYWAVSVYTNILIHSVRWYLGLYHGLRICIGISCLLTIHWAGRVGILRPSKCIARFIFGGARGREKIRLHRQMKRTRDYNEWHQISEQFDKVSGAYDWCLSLCDPEGEYTETENPEMKALQSHIIALQQARESCNIAELVFLLRRCCHRNFCGLRNPMYYAHSFVHTKKAIEDFYDEVCESLDFLADFVVSSESSSVETIQCQRQYYQEPPLPPPTDDRSPSRVYVGYYNIASRRRQPGGDLDQVSTPIGRLSFNAPDDIQSQQPSDPISGPKKFHSAEFLDLLSDLRLSMGRTALCLSGGGALCVLQLGVIKTLMDHDILPTVISGSSGGAFTAALLAVFTDKEFRRDVLCGDFLDKRNLRIVSTFREQINQFWKTGYLLDPQSYTHFARTLIGDITFAEAYARTGRFVSITTTPAGLTGYGEPLVCNVINTPDILIWSAIVASCSLPLVLPPAVLYTKRSATIGSPSWVGINSQLWQSEKPPPPPSLARADDDDDVDDVDDGLGRPRGRRRCNNNNNSSLLNSIPSPPEQSPVSSPATIYRQIDERLDPTIRPYAPDNMLFVDGSILEDIPHTELQTLFNVKSFIVTQVNPHFTPFIQQPGSYKEEKRLFAVILEHIWNYVALDVRNRYARLLLLALVPKIRGQDVSPFLMQSAEGHVTIVPASPSDFWKLTRNPGTSEILRAVSEGERKTWPYIRRLEHGMRIEGKLRQLWQEFCQRGRNKQQQQKAEEEEPLRLPQVEDPSVKETILLDEDDGNVMTSPAQLMLTPRGINRDVDKVNNH